MATVEKSQQFLYRGYSIFIAYVDTYFTFGWLDSNKSIISQYQYGGMNETIEKAKSAVDNYIKLMNSVTIKEIETND